MNLAIREKVREKREEIKQKFEEKINSAAETLFKMIIEEASKGGSLEEILKVLITEKVMSVVPTPRRLRPVGKEAYKKATKIVVRSVVDKLWENNRESLLTHIEGLKLNK